MEQLERLDEVYNNLKYDDNTVLIRILNTFLETGEDNPQIIYNYIEYFIKLLDELYQNSNIKRENIKYVINKIQYIEINPTFDNFIDLVEEIHKKDTMKDYKYLFLLCYCRSRFELYYSHKIYYQNPEYALMNATGNNEWNTFLKAYENNDYVYL